MTEEGKNKEPVIDVVPEPTQQNRMDHGWAWLVAVGAFMVLFVVIAYVRNAGIFLVAIRIRTGASMQEVAWVSTSFNICLQLFTPVACMLSVKFGTRLIVMLGGIMMGSAMLAASILAKHIIFYVVTLGIITGIGAACSVLPSVVIIGYHFKRRLGLATSFAFAGSSIGHMILAPTLTYLMEVYGLDGALLVMSGIKFHIIVAGALFFPIKYPKTNDKDIEVDSRSQYELYQSRISVNQELSNDKAKSSQFIVLKRLLNRPTFYALAVSVCCSTFSFTSVFKYVPSLARDVHVDEDTVALMFTIGGGADLGARLLTGLIADTRCTRSFVKRYRLTAFSVLLMGVNAFVLSWTQCGTTICVCMVIHSTTSGILYATQSVTTLDLLGPELFPLGHSLAAMSGIILAPLDSLVLGKLRDQTGSFTATFSFIGATALISGLALLAQQFLQNLRCSNRTRHDLDIVYVSEPLTTGEGIAD